MSFDVLIIRQIPPIQKGEISSSFCNFFGITPSVTTSSCHSFHRLRAVPLPRGGRYRGANTNNLQINVSSSGKNLFFVRWTAYAPELPPRGRRACRPLCGRQASGTPKVWHGTAVTEGVRQARIARLLSEFVQDLALLIYCCLRKFTQKRRTFSSSPQLVDISKLGLNSKIKKFSYSFICGKGYSPPEGGE